MIDDELKKELIEYIEMEIARRLMTWRKNDNEKIDIIYKQFKNQWIPLAESVKPRIDKIESIVSAHAQGVQNVYDQFSKLTDANFIQNFEAQRVKYDEDFKKMQRYLEECREYINKCYKKMTTINDMYSMRDNNPALVSKLCKIISIIREEDDEHH